MIRLAQVVRDQANCIQLDVTEVSVQRQNCTHA